MHIVSQEQIHLGFLRLQQQHSMRYIIIKWMHWARIIRIDDEHQSEVLATFDGDSVGRWEGDTLVVETVNFMDQPHQPAQRKVVERFSPEPGGGLIYGFTVEDADYADSYGGDMYEHSNLSRHL